MAKGLNSVHLAGTLTQAPELRYTPGGLAILELNLGGNDTVLGGDDERRMAGGRALPPRRPREPGLSVTWCASLFGTVANLRRDP